MEIEVAATYSSSGSQEFDTVADSRGVSINVHYSISNVPKSNGYKPRVADERVGYFTTVYRDLGLTDLEAEALATYERLLNRR